MVSHIRVGWRVFRHANVALGYGSHSLLATKFLCNGSWFFAEAARGDLEKARKGAEGESTLGDQHWCSLMNPCTA